MMCDECCMQHDVSCPLHDVRTTHGVCNGVPTWPPACPGSDWTARTDSTRSVSSSLLLQHRHFTIKMEKIINQSTPQQAENQGKPAKIIIKGTVV
jgi:hypothetical protein